MQRKLKDIYDSKSFYQTKISEKSKNIEKLKQEIKERNLKAGLVVISVLTPLMLGFTGIEAGYATYEKNRIEKQIKEYEKDLEYYRSEIEKLRAKEETLKLVLI